jgi:hypothetical protein
MVDWELWMGFAARQPVNWHLRYARGPRAAQSDPRNGLIADDSRVDVHSNPGDRSVSFARMNRPPGPTLSGATLVMGGLERCA